MGTQWIRTELIPSRMPDNQQIDSALEYAQSHAPVDLNKLSPEGRVLVDDTR